MAYTVSEEWREKCYSGESLYDCRLYIGETLVPTEQIANIKISSPIIDNTSENSNSFYVGSFISQKITIKFNNLSDLDQEIVSNIKSGNDVSLYIGQYTDDNNPPTYEEIPIGKYIIDELGENYYKNWELVCLDYAIKFAQNLDYSGALHDGSIKVDELLEWICDYYGVTLGSYPTTNGDVLVGSYDNTQSGKYYISCIAEIKGCNAKIDRNGALNLIPIKTPPVVTIDATEGAEWELGEKYEVSKVTYYDAVRNYTFGDDSENTLFIRQDNPFVVDENVVLNIYNSICGEQDTTQVSGTSISIDDTVEGPVTLELKPNTSQKTLQGYSLFDFENSTYTTEGSITVTRDVNGYRISNTGTSDNTRIMFANFGVDSSKNYVISFEINNPNGLQYNVGWAGCNKTIRGTTTKGKIVGTLNNITTSTFSLYVNQAGAITFYNIMVYEGTDTTKPYEPYTGGLPSPNPSYPQDVNVVSGDNEVVVCGKNLLNISTLDNAGGSSLTTEIVGNTIKLTQSGTSSWQFRKFMTDLDINDYKGKTLVINGISSNNTNIRLALYDSSKNLVGDLYTTLVIPNDTTASYIGIQLYQSNGTGINGTTTFNDLQVELGSTATPYEPYQSQTYEVDLPVENIASSYDASGSGYYNYNYDNSKVSKNMTLSFMPNFSTTSATIYMRPVSGGTLYTLGTIATITSGERASFSFTLTDAQITEIKATTGGFFQIYRVNVDFTEISVSEVQLEVGSKANSFTPYGTTPIELCKIGDYQDYFTKNSEGQWCKYNAIGKVVLNGSETWSINTNNNKSILFRAISDKTNGASVISNNFKYNVLHWNSIANYEISTESNNNYIFIRDDDMPSTNDFKTWLSTHNTDIYYPLETPTFTKIEGELADQLEDIYNNMRTQLGQTNIMQDNNDLPFNIDINSYFTQDRFLIYSLKHRNYGDLSLDAWDIVNYDVDGTSYPTLNDNTTTYEMTVMSDVQVSIPTAQQEATTNVIGGTQSQKIKRVSTTVDNLSGQITLNAEEIDGLQTNLGKLQITSTNISSTVSSMQADMSTMQTSINQKADNVTFEVYKDKVDNIEENGVTKVNSTMVKIDETGLSVATSTSKITTTMTNNEFRVVANDDPNNPTKLAFIGYDENEHTSKSEMDNLTVKQYFVAGVHRTEALDLTDPATGTTEKRTSVFYTG